jgi:hypothetical protein
MSESNYHPRGVRYRRAIWRIVGSCLVAFIPLTVLIFWPGLEYNWRSPNEHFVLSRVQKRLSILLGGTYAEEFEARAGPINLTFERSTHPGAENLVCPEWQRGLLIGGGGTSNDWSISFGWRGGFARVTWTW